MSEMYDLLAPFYDELNSDVDYMALATYLKDVLEKNTIGTVKTIVDIGCGTGNVTIPLARYGYEMVGVDLSPEMLSVALDRADDAGVSDKIQFVMQDMTELNLYAPVDAVVCTLDGVNHLSNRQALVTCFQAVYNALRPGGMFLFDLNSLYKFEKVYANEVYTMQTEDAFCVWQNDYHPASKYCDFWITLFQRGAGGLYTRYETVQREHYFSVTTVKHALEAAGLTLLNITGGQDGHAVTENDERWYFTAMKGNENGI